MLFEQAALALGREMPVLAAARIMDVTDKRLWRVVHYYVARAVEQLELSELTAFAVDETVGRISDSVIRHIEAGEVKVPSVPFGMPGASVRRQCLCFGGLRYR